MSGTAAATPPLAGQLHVLFEDDHLLAVSKQAGVVAHP